MAVATFCALEGPARLGYASRRDYAHNGLGIGAVLFLRLRRVGALCASQPAVRGLNFSTLDLLAQRLDSSAAAALASRLEGRSYQDAKSIIDAVVASGPGAEPATARQLGPGAALGPASAPCPAPDVGSTTALDAAADPEYRSVSFTVPTAVAGYLHQTVQLASAMLGHDVPDSEAVDAVVAEASTEIPATLEVEEARRCLGVPDDPRPPTNARRNSPSTATVTSPMPRPRFRRDDRDSALVLDRYLARLLSRERCSRTQLEDAILHVRRTEAHRAAGFPSLVAFADRVLDMPPSTLSDHLDRALSRRREHPIAHAVTDGTLLPSKAQLIDRLHRRCHVPASCLPPWIELARTLSFRGLLEAIRWARAQRDTDYRTWSNADFAPPTREQVRASKHPVTEIAAHPTPEILADTARTPTTSVQWVLRRETLDVLLQLMAALRYRTVPDVESAPDWGTRTPASAPTWGPIPTTPLGPTPLPAWWCLLHVFVTARQQWSVIEREPPGYRGRVLRRDDYRCVVPVCSQRRSLEVHHIRFRSTGGDDRPSNLVSLCAFHHTALHDGRLRIRGRVEQSAEDLMYELAIDTHGQAGVHYKGEERWNS